MRQRGRQAGRRADWRAGRFSRFGGRSKKQGWAGLAAAEKREGSGQRRRRRRRRRKPAVQSPPLRPGGGATPVRVLFGPCSNKLLLQDSSLPKPCVTPSSGIHENARGDFSPWVLGGRVSCEGLLDKRSFKPQSARRRSCIGWNPVYRCRKDAQSPEARRSALGYQAEEPLMDRPPLPPPAAKDCTSGHRGEA